MIFKSKISWPLAALLANFLLLATKSQGAPDFPASEEVVSWPEEEPLAPKRESVELCDQAKKVHDHLGYDLHIVNSVGPCTVSYKPGGEFRQMLEAPVATFKDLLAPVDGLPPLTDLQRLKLLHQIGLGLKHATQRGILHPKVDLNSCGYYLVPRGAGDSHVAKLKYDGSAWIFRKDGPCVNLEKFSCAPVRELKDSFLEAKEILVLECEANVIQNYQYLMLILKFYFPTVLKQVSEEYGKITKISEPAEAKGLRKLHPLDFRTEIIKRIERRGYEGLGTQKEINIPLRVTLLDRITPLFLNSDGFLFERLSGVNLDLEKILKILVALGATEET